MISDVYITDLQSFRDERGIVMKGIPNIKIQHKLLLEFDGENNPYCEIGEVYFSRVNPDVVKGWHRHRIMTLHYVCVAGRVMVGLYDDREDSPTRGNIMKIELADQGVHYRMITIPPSVWNGFRALDGDVRGATICNFASHYHDPEEIERIHPDEAGFPFDWGAYRLAG